MKHKEINTKLKKSTAKIKKMSFLKFMPELIKKYPQAGIYVVGGYVRDIVLDQKPKDIDLVINKVDFSNLIDVLSKYGKIIFDLDPKANLSKLNKIERKELLQKGFGVLKFVPEGESKSIDIALPRVDINSKSGIQVEGVKRDVSIQSDSMMNIEDDLGRRDFTVNAIALDLKNKLVIDPYNGISDILNKTLRAIGDAEQRIIKEDLSRAFRGLRFAVQLGFDIEDSTRNAMEKAFQESVSDVLEIYEKEDKDVLDKLITKEKQIRDSFSLDVGRNIPRVLQIFYDRRTDLAKTAVAVEIIAKELLKSIDCDILETLRVWFTYGALNIILPEIVAMRGVSRPSQFHSDIDVYDHTVLSLELALKEEENVELDLKLAILFHSIGKVSTIKFKSKNSTEVSFPEHAQVGSSMTQEIFDRLHMSKKNNHPIVWTIKNYTLGIDSLKNGIKDYMIEKYFFDDQKNGELLLDLIKYDDMATILKEDKKSKLDAYMCIKNRIKKIKKMVNKEGGLPDSLISGDDLISIGIKPSPRFNKILDEIRDMQLVGTIKTKEDAIVVIKKKKMK